MEKKYNLVGRSLKNSSASLNRTLKMSKGNLPYILSMGSNFVASCPVKTDFVKEFEKKNVRR
jgi:hypothetical protein